MSQLATFWVISKDVKTWMFHLGKGVKFRDGTLFNSAAVKFTFERRKDKNVSVVSARFAVTNIGPVQPN